MPSLQHASRTIAYTKTGSGAPVVFVHGSFANSAAWRKIVANLDSERFCAVAVDLPGSGGSEAAVFDASRHLALEAETVEAVINKVAAAPVHLVAHSYGAVIALSLALQERAAIHALTLFEPVPLGVLADTDHAHLIPETVAFVAAYRRDFEAGDQWAARRVFERLGGKGAFEALQPQVREVVRQGTAQNICHWETNLGFRLSAAQCGTLSVPTTIVSGEQSRPVDRLISQRLNQLIPNSALVEIPGAGHFMINTHAVNCASIIDRAERSSGRAEASR